MANLHEQILALCERDGIRPGRLCDELGISRGLMTDLKMGRKKGVNAETAQKIASFFGVSVGCLLGIEGSDAVTKESSAVNLDQIDVAFYGEFKELSDEDKERFNQCVFTDITKGADGSIEIDCVLFDDPDPYVVAKHRYRYFGEGLMEIETTTLLER